MKRFIFVPLTWLAAMFFLIEEFIWDQTEWRMARLGTLSLIRAIERHIAVLPPLDSLLPGSMVSISTGQASY